MMFYKFFVIFSFFMMALSTSNGVDNICETCKYMVKKANDNNNFNFPIEETKTYIYNKCNSLVGTDKKTCQDIAIDYIPFALHLMNKYQDETLVCQEMEFCHNPKKAKRFNKCNVCVGMIDVLKEFVDQNMQPEMVENAFQLFYDNLPDEYEKVYTVINRHIFEIIHWIKDNNNHRNMCKAFEFCII